MVGRFFVVLVAMVVVAGAWEDPLAREHAGIVADIMGFHDDAEAQEPLTDARSGFGAVGAPRSDAAAASSASAYAAGASLSEVGAQQTTLSRSGQRARNRHLIRHTVAARARWPEFEASSEGDAEDAMAKANQGALGAEDIPELAQRFIAWFKYGPKRAKKRMRGRLTYDYKLRKLQVDYFPNSRERETYFFDYQKQRRQIYKMVGTVDPTRRSYKKALKRQKERAKAEAEGEELEPLAPGSNALHQEDMLVLENSDYTWNECTTWDLVDPYAALCPPSCFQHVSDASVGSFPENSVSDDGQSLDPFQEEREVLIFASGYFPAVPEGEDNEETGEKAEEHKPMRVRYAAFRNNTPTEIEMNKSVWTFFRWNDMSDWNNFDLKDSGIIAALDKPDMNCIYSGPFALDIEREMQPFIPLPLLKPEGAEEEDEE